MASTEWNPKAVSLPKPAADAASALASLRAEGARSLAIGLAIFAALRVLIFCLAFPLTNPTDERFHLATIQMYARGRWPGKDLPHIPLESARNLLLYWSPEYGMSPQAMAQDGIAGPLYPFSPGEKNSVVTRDYYEKKLKQWLSRADFEAQSAPLYYMVGAAWYRFGAALGMRDWLLGYWPRFLNPIAYALLVWLSFQFVRMVYPECIFLQVSVPALIAVFPQDVFYGMNRDVFSAPLSAAALLFLMQAIADNRPRQYWSLIVGAFFVGLAFLTSVSNFVLYGALIATLWLWIQRSADGRARKVKRASATILAAIFLPSLWMLRNYVVIGDFTGGKAKTEDFGWTVKPLADMLHHPLFSLHGWVVFLPELIRRFWRGEFVWHGMNMASALADRFYILSSALLLALFLIDFVGKRKKAPRLENLAGLQALALVAGSVLFLAALSVPFDYHDCAYPSREFPYFVSGRIISGAILPFVLMYARGLELIANLFQKWVPPIAIAACLMLAITASELRVRSVVFSSPYNFFALSGWRH